MRRIGAPASDSSPQRRWGRRRGFMRERSHEGHSDTVLSELSPQFWISSLDLDDGTITTWTARVGTSPTQAAAGQRPVTGTNAAGLPCAVFDNTDDELDVSGGVVSGESAFSVIAVAATDTSSGAASTIIQRDGADWTSGGFTMDFSSLKAGTAARTTANSFRVGATTMTASTLHAIGGTVDIAEPGATEIITYLDGSDDGTSSASQANQTGTFASATAYVGGGSVRPLNGDLCEVFVTHSVLTSAEMALAMRILLWRAGARP